ncbi:hypothetical protein JOC78_002555 [Bacillus ectoiniformans]|uniref:TspO/MBR family protein n=1 Tax=Bacillus ectoiniformans TaxID=1494429 RepID=UPI00195E3B42|nr:TspO/MBR family protein [Bacillus ectoiniformans]MBM7649581.1 hypothetical protein [Bacillus ectoiniformans]
MRIFIVNLLALIIVISVNAAANALPLNGQTTGEISNRLNVLFTPAGYVFSIWGFIYLLLGIWVIRQIPKERRNLPLYKQTHLLFILSCLLNIAWIFLWHYEFFAFTVLVMLAFLITLIKLYQKIEQVDFSFMDRLPFSVYLGWISVATIANISYVLKYYHWNGFGLSDTFWAILLLLIATGIAVTFRLSHRDAAFPLVFIWAFIGIAVQNWGDAAIVSYIALAMSAVVFASLFKKA